MSRHGTTRSQIISRRNRGAKTARLSFLARRFGLGIFFSILAVWAVAWILLSGMADRLAHEAEQGVYALLAQAGFTVQTITVEGRDNAEADILRAIVNLNRGDPIFAFDPDETKEMIERLSWVREAHVERRLPSTIYIHISERTPMALWQHKGKLRVIDSEGVTLTDELTSTLKALPIVVGENANKQAAELLSMLAAEPDIQGMVEAASWVGDRRWDLKMKDGTSVRLPESDMGLALRRLAQAQSRDKILDKGLSVIDLREADRIIVRTKPGAVEEYKASFTPGGDNI